MVSFTTILKAYFRQFYYEAVDTEFDFLCKFYKDDIQPEVLQAQLLTFGIEFQRARGNQDKAKKTDIFDVKEYFSSFYHKYV